MPMALAVRIIPLDEEKLMKDQKRKGIVLSYVNIFLNMCANLALVPILIGALSDTEYSIYKVMHSFAGPLMMFNLGLSTVAARSVAVFRGRNTAESRLEKENTLALALLVAVAMAVLVAACGFGLRALVPMVFGDHYSGAQQELAKKILLVFTGVTAARILVDVFRGCILGNERFVFYYGSTTVQYLLRFGSIFALTRLNGCNALQIALVDLGVCALMLLVDGGYTLVCLKEKFRLHRVKMQEVAAITSFSLAILLQAIVTQVNSNVDNVILGAMVENKQIITMYSSALSIYGIFNLLSSVLVNVYFPKAARLVAQEATPSELTDFVIGPSRFQAVLVVGVVAGFALFGQDFITLWIGWRYLDAYYVTLLLIVPAAVPLIQNVCIAILDAKLKRMYRSVVLVIMAVLNVALSIVLVSRIGFWGAAIGTAVSHILGELVLMNLYYHRTLKLEVGRMLREIFWGILPAGLIAAAVCIPLAIWLGNGVLVFLAECALFVAVYALALWLFGLRPEEKAQVKKLLGKIWK